MLAPQVLARELEQHRADHLRPKPMSGAEAQARHLLAQHRRLGLATGLRHRTASARWAPSSRARPCGRASASRRGQYAALRPPQQPSKGVDLTPAREGGRSPRSQRRAPARNASRSRPGPGAAEAEGGDVMAPQGS
ncbi:MAG: hypothetical protein MZV70_45355 [Desulfobacterales bacterium]|nr:hypothetical protein [Desulfobacterales bacterium]